MAQELGFGLAAQTRLATVISELTRNVIRYAGTGELILTSISEGPTRRSDGLFGFLHIAFFSSFVAHNCAYI